MAILAGDALLEPASMRRISGIISATDSRKGLSDPGKDRHLLAAIGGQFRMWSMSTVH